MPSSYSLIILMVGIMFTLSCNSGHKREEMVQKVQKQMKLQFLIIFILSYQGCQIILKLSVIGSGVIYLVLTPQGVGSSQYNPKVSLLRLAFQFEGWPPV